MTVTAGRRPAARAPRPGPARAEPAEQLSRADRVARGKDARAVAPLESHAEFAARRVAGSGRAAAGPGEDRGCRNWCRSGTGGCWCRRSRSTGARRCRWRRTWPPRPPRGCGCSCAGMRTCPISARSPRRSGNLVFDVNDFDETLPGPFEWDVKRLAASLAVAGRDNGFPAKDRRKIVLAAAEGYRTAMRGFAEQPFLDVWYAHLDIEQAIGRVQVAGQGEKVQGRREAAGQGPHRRQHQGAAQAHHHGRRAAADHQRPADDRPDRRGLRRRAGRRDLRADSARCWASTGGRCSLTGGTCWSSSRWSRWPARWSGSAASAPAPGSC